MTRYRLNPNGSVDSHPDGDFVLHRDVERLENERPYWLWRAMLEWNASHKCQRYIDDVDPTPCDQTGDCITEYCVPCAARVFLDKEKEDLADSTTGMTADERDAL